MEQSYGTKKIDVAVTCPSATSFSNFMCQAVRVEEKAVFVLDDYYCIEFLDPSYDL